MDINRFSALFQVVTLSSHTFLPHALGPEPLVLDLGANRGEFHKAFAGRFRAGRYVAVEANAVLADELRKLPGVEVMHCAIAAVDGPVRFGIASNSEASRLADNDSGSGVTVVGRTLHSVLTEARLDRVDLLKADIEGAELPMLMDTPVEILQRIGQITIEFHDFCGIHTPLQVRQMVERLGAAGFESIRFSGNNTNWCFIRRRAPHVSPTRVWIARHFTARLRRLKHACTPLSASPIDDSHA